MGSICCVFDLSFKAPDGPLSEAAAGLHHMHSTLSFTQTRIADIQQTLDMEAEVNVLGLMKRGPASIVEFTC